MIGRMAKCRCEKPGIAPVRKMKKSSSSIHRPFMGDVLWLMPGEQNDADSDR